VLLLSTLEPPCCVGANTSHFERHKLAVVLKVSRSSCVLYIRRAQTTAMCWHCWRQSSRLRRSCQSLPTSKAAHAANAVVHHPTQTHGILLVLVLALALSLVGCCSWQRFANLTRLRLLCRSRWSAAKQGAQALAAQPLSRLSADRGWHLRGGCAAARAVLLPLLPYCRGPTAGKGASH
jgi:hypothetical protein